MNLVLKQQPETELLFFFKKTKMPDADFHSKKRERFSDLGSNRLMHQASYDAAG
jgi:hypothetical protein